MIGPWLFAGRCEVHVVALHPNGPAFFDKWLQESFVNFRRDIDVEADGPGGSLTRVSRSAGMCTQACGSACSRGSDV